MIVRLKNTSPNEIQITILKDNYFSKHRYPGLIMHPGQTIDVAKWFTWTTVAEVSAALATSADFLREYLAGRLVTVALVP
jgi:hypothetical protein